MTTKKDGFGHEKPNEGETNDWITPKWIIDAFNTLSKDQYFYFNTDPYVSLTQPYPTARSGIILFTRPPQAHNQYTVLRDDNGGGYLYKCGKTN